ncbi:MAG: DUF362 domain-containing protein [Candidatus Diapherotrites archaeon]|nr:DUF362 domain-containing protein [Candidatus Diapherotrites archaeon]
MVKVSMIKCLSYDEKQVQAAVKKAVDALGGFGKFVKKGQKVLLKVNLLESRKPEECVTTHPSIVKAVALLCKKQGAKVFIGDSPAVSGFEKSAETAGFAQVCKETGARLVELSEPVETKTKTGFAAKKLFISRKLNDFDVIINLPKLKTHIFTGFTGAVKNCYGCVPKRIKGEYHLKFPDSDSFSKMLLDLHSIVKPNLSIMDAVFGMEGEGPSAGSPKQIGAILASESAIALDFIAVQSVGIRPEKISLLAFAKKLGLEEFDRIQLLGDFKAGDFPIVKDFKPSKAFNYGLSRINFLAKLLRKFFNKKPALISEKCISCGKCFEACPAGAIDFKTKKPVFDYSKCIKCFCCQEVCPQKAIITDYSLGLKIFKKLKG